MIDPSQVKIMNKTIKLQSLMAITAGLMLAINVNADVVNATGSGTFTMSLDRNALAAYAGTYYLSTVWDATASDPSNAANTGDYYVSHLNTTEISAINLVHALTPIGQDPSGQANKRFVKATTADFAIDTDTLAGVVGAKIGMTGVQGFYAPNYPPNGAGLVNGDFSVEYDTARQTDGRTGWYLANNIYFNMAVYDLSHLALEFTDANNWQFSGDLLMSPENGSMLKGAALTDVGNFCLGVGSYAGCSPAPVPVPAAVWLFASALLGFTGLARRESSRLIASK